MSSIPGLFLGLVVGTSLGFLYFFGLWWTTRRITRPGGLSPFFFASFLGRLALCLAGFYLILSFAGPVALLSSVTGFMIMQFVFVRRLGKKGRLI